MTDANLTQTSVQLESTFGGSGTGSIYRLRGVTGLEESQRRRQGPQRVGVWRHVVGMEVVSGEVELSADLELSPSRALALAASTMLSQTSETTLGAGLVRRRYSPPRVDAGTLPSLKLLVVMAGGPWITCAGCRLSSLRLTAAARDLAKAALTFVGASRARAESDPGWSEVVEDMNNCRAADCVVSLDGTPLADSTEVSCEVQFPLEGRAASRSGAPTRVSRSGPLAVTGSLKDRFGSLDLVGAAEDGAEHTLALTFTGVSVAGRLVSLVMPRVMLTKADPALAGQGDATVECSFQSMEDRALGATQTYLEVISAT